MAADLSKFWKIYKAIRRTLARRRLIEARRTLVAFKAAYCNP